MYQFMKWHLVFRSPYIIWTKVPVSVRGFCLDRGRAGEMGNLRG